MGCCNWLQIDPCRMIQCQAAASGLKNLRVVDHHKHGVDVRSTGLETAGLQFLNNAAPRRYDLFEMKRAARGAERHAR